MPAQVDEEAGSEYGRARADVMAALGALKRALAAWSPGSRDAAAARAAIEEARERLVAAQRRLDDLEGR